MREENDLAPGPLNARRGGERDERRRDGGARAGAEERKERGTWEARKVGERGNSLSTVWTVWRLLAAGVEGGAHGERRRRPWGEGREAAGTGR